MRDARSLFPLVAMLLAAVLLVPGPAWATCMEKCQAGLALPPECKPPVPADTLEVGTPLTFTASCETCCSPPGGPVTCEPASVPLDALALFRVAGTLQVKVDGNFAQLKMMCPGGKAIFQFMADLVEGSYELRSGGTNLFGFQVVKAAGGCHSDMDCDICAQCKAGNCVPVSSVECESDSDCFDGEYCFQDSFDECLRYCVSEGPGDCEDDWDCPDCEECVLGACIATCTATCVTDEDCPPEAICVETWAGCCSECQVKPSPCKLDSDCGACQTCLDGTCLGGIVCLQDDDCPPGYSCVVGSTTPCANHCDPKAGEDVSTVSDSGSFPDAGPTADIPAPPDTAVQIDSGNPPETGSPEEIGGILEVLLPDVPAADDLAAVDAVGPKPDALDGEDAAIAPEGSAGGKSSGCAQGTSPAGSVAFLALLGFGMWAVRRRTGPAPSRSSPASARSAITASGLDAARQFQRQ